MSYATHRSLEKLTLQVGRRYHADWWQNLLLQARSSDVHLVLPGLNLAHLQTPLAGRPSHRLRIAAYRVINAQWEPGFNRDEWAIVSQEVIVSLRLVQSSPLILKLDYPDEWDRPYDIAYAAMILAVQVETYDAEGEAHQQLYHLRMDPYGEGIYPVVPFEPRYREAEPLFVDPLLLGLD